jgi:hypothetical protein
MIASTNKKYVTRNETISKEIEHMEGIVYENYRAVHTFKIQREYETWIDQEWDGKE